jgi:hypothetical protein
LLVLTPFIDKTIGRLLCCRRDTNKSKKDSKLRTDTLSSFGTSIASTASPLVVDASGEQGTGNKSAGIGMKPLSSSRTTRSTRLARSHNRSGVSENELLNIYDEEDTNANSESQGANVTSLGSLRHQHFGTVVDTEEGDFEDHRTAQEDSGGPEVSMVDAVTMARSDQGANDDDDDEDEDDIDIVEEIAITYSASIV